MRNRLCFGAAALAVSASPASAQFYWQPAPLTTGPIAGYETGMGVPLPGANPKEQQAAIAWNMRSALNVAALQCSFEPTLRVVENYNAIINNHGAELTAAFATLTAYFKRTSKTAAAGQKALDTFGTRTYSGYSVVQAQYEFCSAAGRVGRRALFAPRGGFTAMAGANLRELRSSLTRTGDQQFRFRPARSLIRLPVFEERCWKKNRYISACGYS